MFVNMKRKIGALLLAVLTVVSMTACGAKEDAAEESGAPAGVAVQVQNVVAQDISADSIVSGKVTADGETAVYVMTTAKCSAVYVSAGQKVTAGTVLCTLDMSSATQEYSGSYVSSMANYNAQKDILDRQVAMAEKNYNDTLRLLEIGAASQLEADSAELQYLSAKTQRDSTLMQLAASMQSSQSNLMGMKLAVENVDADGNVHAPAGGTITTLGVRQGEMVSSSQPIAVIDSVDQMRISVDVSEALMPKLRVGDTASVTISSLNKSFDATIRSIDPAANLQTQLYGVQLTVPAEIGNLRAGIFADVAFHTDTSVGAVVVPTECILTANGESFVFIVEDGTAKKMNVVVGLSGNGITEVTEGISAGSSVVTVGQQYLSDGDAVRIVEG